MHIDYSKIDAEIVEIIKDLNGLGYVTRYCCAGHLKKPSFYIMFAKKYDFPSCPKHCFFESEEPFEDFVTVRGGVKDEKTGIYGPFSNEDWNAWKKMSDEEKIKYNKELLSYVREWVDSLPSII